MAGSKWINKAISKPGQLHRDLGVPQGQKIPAAQLDAAAKRPGKVGQRARLAEEMRSFSHSKSSHPAEKSYLSQIPSRKN